MLLCICDIYIHTHKQTHIHTRNGSIIRNISKKFCLYFLKFLYRILFISLLLYISYKFIIISFMIIVFFCKFLLQNYNK